MARIYFPADSERNYFLSLKTKSKLSWQLLASKLEISARHLRDIRNGKHSLSFALATRIEENFQINLPLNVITKEDKWYLPEAARKGGKTRFKLYGPPGTPEGRRKGGKNSIVTHIKNMTGFYISKQINYPEDSEDLAEILGAFHGDGTLTKWQAKIYLNLKTDVEYAYYLKSQLEKVFKINVGLFERMNNSTIVVVVNSNKLSEFLHKKGMPIGNKIKQNLNTPSWILSNKTWQRAYLRGLFDTDGCTYIDHHEYKEKTYKNLGVAFASASSYLLESIFSMLKSLGYSPTNSTRERVLLRKKSDIIEFFEEIKPSCKRHQVKFKEFMEEYQSGRNGPASKAAVAVR